jgi:hypothetical protein
MKTTKAMKNAKPMKTTKAMKNAKPTKAMKSAKATCHAKLMKAIKCERSEHDKAMTAMSLKLMKTMAFTRAMNVTNIEICYNDPAWSNNMWWALSTELSADLLRQFRLIKEGPKLVYFSWAWPQGKEGTAMGLDGKPTNFSSFILDFDTMTQRNIDTDYVRKFRVVQVVDAQLPDEVAHSLCEIYTHIHRYTKEMYVSPSVSTSS